LNNSCYAYSVQLIADAKFKVEYSVAEFLGVHAFHTCFFSSSETNGDGFG